MVDTKSKGEILTSVLGIIAEFNPFHNGHLHLIQTARQTQDFSAIVCVMSGNFLQRGDVALCNKWVRARMALQAGADLVIELPFCFAVRSAYFFARGSIELLYRTTAVSHLAFGSESGMLGELQSISTIIAHENQEYKTHLKYHLDQGLSFPSARALAIRAIIGKQVPGLEQIIMQPNNILALEYLRVLEQQSIPLKPLTIARKGSGYNSLELSPYASASAIRRVLLSPSEDIRIEDSMPLDSLALLNQEICAGRAPVTIDALEQSILGKLRTIPLKKLRQIYEVTEGLENRIKQAAISSGTLEELRQSIKSKRYSLTRINRILLYSLLDVEGEQMLSFDQHGPLYMHILGFSTKGQKILQTIKNKSKLRVLNRGSEVKKACQDTSDPTLQAMLGLDVRATDIYCLLYPNSSTRHGSQDFTTSPVIVGDDANAQTLLS
ncbi:MAG: nucleotidyltransferase [Firmicutes bacterium HGW-Firmicutes-15]|nr:MAG: nucleotidyltransferase [Firmicutes bacterium HGW-Firmicutes-15]